MAVYTLINVSKEYKTKENTLENEVDTTIKKTDK